MTERDYDVVVVGCGLAGLSAALAARSAGASVLALEAAPERRRGGNTAFSHGGMRTWRTGNAELEALVPGLTPEQRASYAVDPYSEDDYYDHIMRVTKGRADPELARLLVHESFPTALWLREQGVHWEPQESPLSGGRLRIAPALSMIHCHGYGSGLVTTLFEAAQQRGVDIAYETRGVKLLQDSSGRVTGVTAEGEHDGFSDVRSGAVVLAAGGYESNREWRAKYLGPGWSFVRPRGTSFNQGGGLRMALEVGAQRAGDWSGAHAAAMDWEAMSAPEGQDVSDAERKSRSGYQLCVEVNVHGERFLDEGEDWSGHIYVKHGWAIVSQPEVTAWQIFESRSVPLLIWKDRYRSGSHVAADSIEELAVKLGTPHLVRTIAEYNAAVQSNDWPPDLGVKDGKGTVGLTPPKSNWARRIEVPPFEAYKITTGITFTFGGVKINRHAQVIDTEHRVIPGLYAAGNTAGGVWHHNYPSGSSLAFASVFGRIAGATAAGG